MLLYVIRHGDPDYANDSLKPLGKLQAQAVGKRLATYGFDRIYSSPMGRAKETAQPLCDLLHMEMEIEPWTSEAEAFKDFAMVHPNGRRTWVFHGKNTILREPENLKVQPWYDAPCFRDVPNAKSNFERIIAGSDDFLARQGYVREGGMYRIERPNEDRVALFCHQGFSTLWFSHLLQIPPQLFWSTFDVTHSSVSVFQFVNYTDGKTVPKCLCLSDMSHIYAEGLPMRYNNILEI